MSTAYPPSAAGPQRHDGFPRLLGDIGGTHARWAWQSAPGEPLQMRAVHRTVDDPGPLASARRFLSECALPAPQDVAIGVATAIQGDAIRMTNLAWEFSLSALRDGLGARRCIAINDFTALALAVPELGSSDLQALGGGSAVENAAKAVIGPGTGLGVSGLVADRHGGWQAISGEGGHVTLAATDAAEAELMAVLRARFGHVSAERVLSGSGLVNLHAALCERDGVPNTLATAVSQPALATPPLPGDITAAAISRADPRCTEALRLFTAFLGDVAGNLALTLGARGGVYLGGGIVPRLGAHFDAALFRRRFEQKGRFASYLAAIPVWLIIAEAPALYGAARALDIPPEAA